MNGTIDYLRSNRKWLVRDYRIWGNDGAFGADMFMTEQGTSNNRVIYSHQYSGGKPQVVNYADLLDHRGNKLPSNIQNPEVVIIQKNPVTGFIIGSVGSSSFRIAKSYREPADSIVDLLIMEMN